MIMVILTILSLSVAIVWSIVFLPMSILGIRIHKINGTMMKKFLKGVKHSSIWNNDEPEGWICGLWFIGYVQVVSGDRNETKDLWLISSSTYYKQHIKQNENENESQNNKITYWTREGSFWIINYTSRSLDIPKKPIQLKQSNAIEHIIAKYDEKTHVVCLLHGKAGGGKSMTTQYLCSELLKTKKGVHFCDTHAPYEHGDNFETFYNKISPTSEYPLVLAFEEVDGLIMNLHFGKIVQGNHNPIQIKNKTDWNSFLDKFDRDIYSNVIIVMTTNMSAEWFDELDKSYMREGRVDLKIEF
jgi:hypothetical protein